MNMGISVAVLAALTMAGCALPVPMTEPVSQTTEPMTAYDRDTDYAITPREGGYSVAVKYSRYQFIPESAVVADACRRMALAIAHEHAEKARRPIHQVNEQRLVISTGRNGLLGITSCEASVPVEWK